MMVISGDGPSEYRHCGSDQFYSNYAIKQIVISIISEVDDTSFIDVVQFKGMTISAFLFDCFTGGVIVSPWLHLVSSFLYSDQGVAATQVHH